MCGKNKKERDIPTHKITVEELNKKVLEVMRKEIGDIEVLCCKNLTREIAIKYLRYVSVDCIGNIELIYNKMVIM